MTAFLFLILTLITPAQKTQYACLPCGQSCDHKSYDKPGHCPSCGMDLVEKSTLKVKDVSFRDVCERLKANPKALVLDVRSPQEFKGTSSAMSFGHFANAININVDDLPARLDEIKRYKDQEVIVYCSHSHRSPRASYILSTNGFSNVKNVEGGVSTIDQDDKECLGEKFVSHKH